MFHFLTATYFVYFDRISSVLEMSSPFNVSML